MSFIGIGASARKSSSKTSYTANKETKALFNPLFQQAQTWNNQQFTPYQGQLSQGMNADQTGARAMLQQGQGQDATNSAIGSAQGLLGYQPNQINAPTIDPVSMADPKAAQAAQMDRSQVRNLTPQTFAGSDLSAYMNPYTSQVVDQTLADINRQREIAVNGQAGQFTQAGAFGGSRHGVADALTNEAYGRQSAMTAAQLRSQGFDTAAGLLNGDINRNMQADSANQAADLNILGQNAGYQQQSNLFNAGAANDFASQNANYDQQTRFQNAAANMQAQQANQSAGLQGQQQQLAAAGLLGDLGAQQQNMGLLDANARNAMGTQEQQMQQDALDREYQQYLLQQGYSQQQIQNNLGLLGSIGNLYAGATQKGSGTQIGVEASASYGKK